MNTVLITGTNRGIGLELVRQYAEAGDTVIACCRNPSDAKDLNALTAGREERVSVHQLDVADPKSVDALRADIGEKTIDILINNAGTMGGDVQSAFDMDYDAWQEALAINTIGPFRVIEALIDALRKSAAPKIMTISSQMGALNLKGTGSYAYRSSKAAVNKVMQVLAQDLRPEGIIAIPVHPGWVQTEMGGPNAEITTEESATGLRKLLAGLTLAESGQFFNWNGTPHVW